MKKYFEFYNIEADERKKDQESKLIEQTDKLKVHMRARATGMNSTHSSGLVRNDKRDEGRAVLKLDITDKIQLRRRSRTILPKPQILRQIENTCRHF